MNLPDTVFDVSTDSAQGWAFIDGTNYTKLVNSTDDPLVAEYNCLFDGPDEAGMFQANCLERDPIWGVLTWAVMFLPGLSFYAMYKGNYPSYNIMIPNNSNNIPVLLIIFAC